MSEIRISVHNEGSLGGLANTPVWFGLHDGSFDLFNIGEAASAGLESLAEDGALAAIATELAAADENAQGGAVFGERGGNPAPIAAGEFFGTIVETEGFSSSYISLASMVLPSNDAFFGTGDAVRVFDDNGGFAGRLAIEFNGDDVYDAGTEVNTELDAAFINQTAPNTGETEGGAVRLHAGFNGSLGNPQGEGDQIILGGTNAFGQAINPAAADFTQPDFDLATVYINRVSRTDLSASTQDEHVSGNGDDDIMAFGSGDDVAFGRGGNDEITGGDGNDQIRGGDGLDIINGDAGDDWIFGGNGADFLYGGDDNDTVIGGGGGDTIQGGDGNDFVAGNDGNDVLSGGNGNDIIIGGEGADLFILDDGAGHDIIRDLNLDEGDQLLLDSDSGASFSGLTAAATQSGNDVFVDFGDDASLTLRGISLEDLSADAVLIV